MGENQGATLLKRTLFGYAFYIGICLAFCMYLEYSYHLLHYIQQEYQQTQLQEELSSLHKL